MPYTFVKTGDKWTLQRGQEVLGTHNLKRECVNQMQSIYSAELNRPENIYINGPIDAYSSMFIDDKIASSGEELNVVVNSKGGDYFDSLDIHQKFRNSGKKVIVHINPLAFSGAAIVALAGDEIYMPANGLMMFHTPRVEPQGAKDADELEKMTAALRAAESSIVNTLMSKTKKSKEECEKIMKSDTWLTAQEAKDLGIVTEIVPIFRDIQIQNYFPERIVNFVRENSEMGMKEICDQFGVADETGLVNLISELRKNQIPKSTEISPAFLNMIKGARETQINNLVATGKCTPVVAADMKLKFVNDERIKLDGTSGASTEFDYIVSSYLKNEPIVNFDPKTGVQQPEGTGTATLTKETPGKDDDVLQRDWERRRKLEAAKAAARA